jgi:DNA-binding MarR family transcriptional regulator
LVVTGQRRATPRVGARDDTDPAGGAQGTRADDVAEVADTFLLLQRRFTRLRARLLAESRHDVEWSSELLITYLALDGPMRSSALAELVQSDPSTVSRQVAALVGNGYVERRADPGDGRASLLVVTEAGERVYREHLRVRHQNYRRMLADWTPQELRTFSSLLGKFGRDIERSRPAMFTGANSETNS